MDKRTSLGVAAAAALACGSAHADILNYRDWLDANPTTPNSTANEWYGTIDLSGPMMTSQGTAWVSPGYPANTPVLALRTSVGSDNGAAGPATFEGSWVHPGSGVPAVLVFAPTVATLVGGMDVRSELIANGLSGNGITITVYATIGGNTSTLGTTSLAGISTSVLNSFNLPNVTTLNPGDSLSVAFGDNGSYLFDHVNFNAWITIPSPGAIALLGIGGLAAARRRRRVGSALTEQPQFNPPRPGHMLGPWSLVDPHIWAGATVGSPTAPSGSSGRLATAPATPSSFGSV